VPSGNLNGQVRTHGELGDAGFSSNPQDLIFVNPNSAWVPRHGVNLNPGAPAENQGNDLFEIDPTEMTATGARIDLSSLNTTVKDVEVFARPSRGVLIGSTMVVGLDRLSEGFDVAGSGMVAVVDLANESAEGLELTGLESCAWLVPIPGAPTKVAVACIGFPFDDEALIRASAGIAVLAVSPSGVTVERTWRAADDPSSAIAVNALVAIDDQHVLAVANGNFVDTTDALYEVDLTNGDQELVHVSTGSFTIGVSAWDPDSEMLYVPDAAANAVIELASDGNGFTEVGTMEIAPSLGLPPTQVYLLN
jgi:hypothetical protein